MELVKKLYRSTRMLPSELAIRTASNILKLIAVFFFRLVSSSTTVLMVDSINETEPDCVRLWAYYSDAIVKHNYRSVLLV